VVKLAGALCAGANHGTRRHVRRAITHHRRTSHVSTLTVALLQINPCGTGAAANAERGEAWCRRARQMGADIALFPEMWSIGYTLFAAPESFGELWRGRAVGSEGWASWSDSQVDIARWRELAISRDDPFIDRFKRLARELEMAIAVTYLERWPGAPRNTMSLIDRHGEVVLTYAKVHTCDFDMEFALTPGEGFPVAELDTAGGPVRVGTMICYDREFPESARILMLNGAELVLTPNCCELEVNRLTQFRTRANENAMAVAMVNYPRPRSNGHSVAYHPVAFDPDGRSRDTLVVEAGEQEGIHLAHFDLAEIRDWRARDGWGCPFRRPHRYAALTRTEVAEPFVRVNERGERYEATLR
jgi:N-carbamoylputrescine amidase